MLTLSILAIIALAAWGTAILLRPTPAGPPVAPDPAAFDDAVVQVYGADVWGIRGRFAIHTWIATKAPNADHYTIYHVLGWRKFRGMPVVSIEAGTPNQKWFGAEPILLLDKRGPDARSLVGRIDHAAREYPYPESYTMWPGPNSNSFIAWIGLKVPELGLKLPAKALGKNWMAAKLRKARRLNSGTGFCNDGVGSKNPL